MHRNFNFLFSDDISIMKSSSLISMVSIQGEEKETQNTEVMTVDNFSSCGNWFFENDFYFIIIFGVC